MKIELRKRTEPIHDSTKTECVRFCVYADGKPFSPFVNYGDAKRFYDSINGDLEGELLESKEVK